MFDRDLWRACTTCVAVTLFAWSAHAEEAKQLTTEKGKPVVLGNMAGKPASCSSNPGPLPIPQLRSKPSHGAVLMQTAEGSLAATDSCPARKIPGLVLIYVPNADFVGEDFVQIELEAGNSKLPEVSFRITVTDPDKK